MSSKTRWIVLLVSTPLVILVAVGGILGASAPARQGGFTDLRIFNEVISFVLGAYVEEVDVDRIMDGAMHGLAESLDASSAFLKPDEVKFVDAGMPLPEGRTGLEITRQFYLRVLGVREGSSADKAGLRTGDYIRMIGDVPTRDMSAIAGERLLAGEPGTTVTLLVIRNNAADPHEVTLTREVMPEVAVTGRQLPEGGPAYLRVAGFGEGATAAIREQVTALGAAASKGLIIDLRGAANGELEEGLAAARLFADAGTLATLAGREGEVEPKVVTADADGAFKMPLVLLVSSGTARAAELFASALATRDRADLVGEPTAGLASVQELVRLPEDHGLWITTARYIRQDGQPIDGQGLAPDVAVESPFVPFGEPAPANDRMLEAAIAHLAKQQ